MSRCKELGVQPPVGFWDPAGLSKDGDVEVSMGTHSLKCIDPFCKTLQNFAVRSLLRSLLLLSEHADAW